MSKTNYKLDYIKSPIKTKDDAQLKTEILNTNVERKQYIKNKTFFLFFIKLKCFLTKTL